MMKRAFLVFLLVILAGQVRAEAISTALTLRECYELALRQSEAIAIQQEYINETKGQILEALSTALPKVAFAYSEKWEDAQGRRSLGGSTPEGKFTLSQPLFTGFKEFAAIAASRHVGRQREQELIRARELLFIDVADAFYLYLTFQEDLGVVEQVQKVLLDRLAELKRRQTIGKSRPSEVASAEAKLGRTMASLETLRGQKEVSGQLLQFLIGQSFDRLVDEALVDEDPKAEQLYAAVEQRADIIAARESLAAFRSNVTAARSAFFPAVTLAGNSYTKRADAYEGNDWDATLTVSVPLFDGLNNAATFRQAKSQEKQADLKLAQVRRKALLEVRNAFVRYQLGLRRTKALDLAVRSAEKNYQLQAEDFQRSLVSNLDVLQALEDLQAVRRELVASRNDASRSFWTLKIAVGGI